MHHDHILGHALLCCAVSRFSNRAVPCRSPAPGPHPSPLRGGHDGPPGAVHPQGPPAAPRGPPQPLTQFPLELGLFINKLPPERDLQGGHPNVDQVKITYSLGLQCNKGSAASKYLSLCECQFVTCSPVQTKTDTDPIKGSFSVTACKECQQTHPLTRHH